MDSPIHFSQLPKLRRGDRVAIVSPSYAAPGRWPHLYELALTRLRDDFGLLPVAYPSTAKLGASTEERSADLVAAFTDPTIKAVIATIGGDDEVVYVKNLPIAPFYDNPKPFFGFSDCTHLANFLWLNGIPSYYGGALFTQFAQTPTMDPFTVSYLREALFGGGDVVLKASALYNEILSNWDDPSVARKEAVYEPNDGWHWDGDGDAVGVTWGGCLESIDDLLRNAIRMPSMEQFEHVVLIAETSEETPPPEYVRRVFRALGERGILARIRAVLVGRPQAWTIHRPLSAPVRAAYRQTQRDVILQCVRSYNPTVPVVQNMDFGHTNPQICLPYGAPVRVSSTDKTIGLRF